MAVTTKKTRGTGTQTAVLEPEEAAQPLAPPHGRTKKPNGTLKPAASPDAFPPNVDFWDHLSGFTNDEWQYLIGYLWRTAPTIDRRANGKPISIGKYTTKFDIERVKLDYGSGGYRIDFCKITPGTSQQQRIAQHYFQIMNLDHPPKVPFGDWLQDDENEAWQWAEPALKARAAEAAAAPAAAAAPDPNVTLQNVLTTMKLVRGEQPDNNVLAATVLEMVGNNQKAMMELNDPAKQITTLSALLQLIPKPVEAKQNDLVVEILRDQLNRTTDEMKELRKELRERDQKPAPSMLEQVKELVPSIKEIAGVLGFKAAGAAAAGSETDWGAVAITAIDKLADHVPLIVDAIRTRGSGALPDERVERWPTSGASAAQPKTIDTTATVQNETPPAASETEDQKKKREKREAEQQAKVIWQKYGGLIQAIAPFLVDHFRGNLTGFDFRDWLLKQHGRLNWTGLRDEIGAEHLCALAQQHPHLRVALAPPEKLLEFLKECFTEVGEEPDDQVVKEEQVQ